MNPIRGTKNPRNMSHMNLISMVFEFLTLQYLATRKLLLLSYVRIAREVYYERSDRKGKR